MNITKMLKPDVLVWSKDNVLEELDVFFETYEHYECIQFVLEEEWFMKFRDLLLSKDGHKHYVHIYLVRKQRTFDDVTYLSPYVSYSSYGSFANLSTVLALQTSAHYVRKGNYRLGYVHAMLAHKYLEDVKNSIFLWPRVSMQVGFCLHHMGKQDQSLWFYQEGIKALYQNDRGKNMGKKELLFFYVDDFLYLASSGSFVVDDSIKRVFTMFEDEGQTMSKEEMLDLHKLYKLSIEELKMDKGLKQDYQERIGRLNRKLTIE
jgi:hypothetical protein